MKIRTEKQKAASRLNGRKSQGPVTQMGKDRVRMNAITHGLTAKTTVLLHENKDQFQHLLISLLDDFRPATDAEFLCVEEMAMAKWRLRRVIGIETAACDLRIAAVKLPSPQATVQAFTDNQLNGRLMTTLRQHETAYSHLYQRAYRHLTQLQTRRAGLIAGQETPVA